MSLTLITGVPGWVIYFPRRSDVENSFPEAIHYLHDNYVQVANFNWEELEVRVLKWSAI